jgi:hypothetical protein
VTAVTPTTIEHVGLPEIVLTHHGFLEAIMTERTGGPFLTLALEIEWA